VSVVALAQRVAAGELAGRRRRALSGIRSGSAAMTRRSSARRSTGCARNVLCVPRLRKPPYDAVSPHFNRRRWPSFNLRRHVDESVGPRAPATPRPSMLGGSGDRAQRVRAEGYGDQSAATHGWEMTG